MCGRGCHVPGGWARITWRVERSGAAGRGEPCCKCSACEAQAAQKKLAGAAKNSFVTKCQKDATASAAATCESQAAEKKLYGAAKNSFVKKRVTDATKA